MTKENIISAFRDLQACIHSWAQGRGWWNDAEQRNIPSKIALMHSELSEALEAYRKPPDDYGVADTYWVSEDSGVYPTNENWSNDDAPLKPEGLGIELADCIIRILDTAGFLGIDMSKCLLDKIAYNDTRPYRHGGKKC